MALLMSVMVPRKVMVALGPDKAASVPGIPVPFTSLKETVRLAVWARVSVPLAALRVSWTGFVPASTSLTAMLVMVRGEFSNAFWVAGTATAGGWLTAFTVIGMTICADSGLAKLTLAWPLSLIVA